MSFLSRSECQKALSDRSKLVKMQRTKKKQKQTNKYYKQIVKTNTKFIYNNNLTLVLNKLKSMMLRIV